MRSSLAVLAVFALLDCKASEPPALVSVQPGPAPEPEPVAKDPPVEEAPAFVVEGPIETRAAVSECGGFHTAGIFQPKASEGAQLPSATLGFLPAPLAQDTEPRSIPGGEQRLRWSYERGTLRIINEGVRLNCCGDPLQAVLEQGEEGWVMRELEPKVPRPPGPGGICGCICAYDFAVEAINVPEAPLQLTVTRELQRPAYDDAELPEGQPVWTGTLDLSEGAGSIYVGRIQGCERELACRSSGTCPIYGPPSEAQCANTQDILEMQCADHYVRYVRADMFSNQLTQYWDRRTGMLVGEVEWGDVDCGELPIVYRGEVPELYGCRDPYVDLCRRSASPI